MIRTENDSYDTIIFNLNWSKTRGKDDIPLYTGATLLGDYEYIMSKFNNRVSLVSVLAYVCNLPLSLAKIMCFIPKQLMKPNTNCGYVEPESSISEVNEPENDLEESDDLFHDIYCLDNMIKSQKANNLIELRKYLYTNDFKLHGNIIKRIEHRVSDEDMLRSVEDKNFMPKFSTTQITFGNDLNKILSMALPNIITLKKRTISDETYVLFKDDDYGFLEETLKRVYLEPIKVIID